VTRVLVVGGGIAGLAAARQLEALIPDGEVVLVERSERLGGKLLTEREGGFVVEGAADSFLSRKPRGVGLSQELGLELVGRRPEHAKTFVRSGGKLHPLPAGLTGMIPTNLDALEQSTLLSREGRERLAAEIEIPVAPPDGDESIASFVSRRLGPEAYEMLVEPLMTGIYGGDGDQLSLQATYPNLRALELEHGSVVRGLASQPVAASPHPPFVSFRGGMQSLVDGLAAELRRTNLLLRFVADRLDFVDGRYAVALRGGSSVEADGVVLALPAFAVAKLFSGLDVELAQMHEEIPYASSAIVSLGYRRDEVPHPLDGYGYLVPRAEASDVLACTWSSSKWSHRAPADRVLLRIYAGRVGRRDVTRMTKAQLLVLARGELDLLGIDAEPSFVRIHRWRYGMPQYVLGHPERLERIDTALERHSGLALAGAAYRGVGIPDCIHSGEQAALTVARSIAGVTA
jgi:protoporphyrinogen/coproporphyrinogen III oxidase